MVAVIIAAAIVVILASSGSSNHAAQPAKAPLPQPTSKVRLVSPSGAQGEIGIAEVVRDGNNSAVAVVAKGLRPNTKHNAYAIWLYNSSSDALRLGFVNPGVGKNGHLDTAGVLPSNAGNYSKLVVTTETTSDPQSPGPIVLEGSLRRR